MKTGVTLNVIGQHDENEEGESNTNADADADRGFASMRSDGQRDSNQNKRDYGHRIREPFAQLGSQDRKLFPLLLVHSFPQMAQS